MAKKSIVRDMRAYRRQEKGFWGNPMVGQLILKDLMAHKRNMTLIFIFFLIAGNSIVFRYWPWHVYMMYGYMALAFLSTSYAFTDKRLKTEVLSCSLPVTRTSIVIARYSTVALVVIIGLTLWFLNAFLAHVLYPDAVADFNTLMNVKVLIMALLFQSLHAGIFLPALFRFGFMGSVNVFIVAIVTSITSIALIFHPWRSSYSPYVETGEIPLMSALILVLIAAPLISLTISINVYCRKDM